MNILSSQNKTINSIWSPGYFSLLCCLALSFALVAFYLYFIKPFLFLPADILMWSESNFVGDIIKIRIGEPFYTLPEDNNSLLYPPGSVMVTYFISWVLGKSTSIPYWRLIQLIFVAFSAAIASVCSRLLHNLSYPDHRIQFSKTWHLFTFFAMFLAATSPNVNKYIHALHTDPLALLLSILSFMAILLYLRSPNVKHVVAMAAFPALGYLVKQNMLIWGVIMFFVLILHHQRKMKHIILFLITAGSLTLFVVGSSYLIWGDPYIFWTITLPKIHQKISFHPGGMYMSLPRSFDHILRSWMEISLGIIGGVLVLRGNNIRRLGPLWFTWLILVVSEAFTSGSGWGALYHFGPGVVVGTIWLFSALPYFWPSFIPPSTNSDWSITVHEWMKPVIAIAAILTVFTALRVVPTGDIRQQRYWKRQPMSDVYRYIYSIEQEFKGLPAHEILLDIGNWIYLRHSILAKDRAISLADQPSGGIFKNIEVMIKRIEAKAYKKILVRNFHSPFFLYDWVHWEKPSGVRKALQENYTEIRIIPPVKIDPKRTVMVRINGPVSVLVPREP